MCTTIFKSAHVYLIFLYTNIYASYSESEYVINTAVTIRIDISASFVQKTHIITFSSVKNETVSNYVFLVEPEMFDHLAHIEAMYLENKKPIVIQQKVKTRSMYTLTVHRKCDTCSVTIIVELFYVNCLVSYPLFVTQKETHLVMFNGNEIFYTPYTTKYQICYIFVGNGKILDIKGTKHSVNSDGVIKFDKHTDVLPYTSNTVEVHYENNSPFLKVIHLERTIKVSHWGYIHVEDKVIIKNDAARFKGGFNRLLTEYQNVHNTLVPSFTSTLPAEAFDIYYKDSIGNISTSTVEKFGNFTSVKLNPRFVLYGGWKVSYTLGYTLNCNNYIFKFDAEKNIYVLTMNILDLIFPNMIIEEALFKIYLPEGANEIHLDMPFSASYENNSIHYTSCDTLGHKVITMRAVQLTNRHVKYFSLYYVYNNFTLVLKPLAISLFNLTAFILFIASRIIYSKLPTL